MDFVQRNLINERNNLQIELAKANILIAQLNELSNKTLGSYIKKASGVDTEPGFVDWRKRNDVMTLAYDAEKITDAGGDASEFRNKLKNRQEGIGRAVDQLTSRLVDAKYKRLVPKPTNEQAEYISDLENVIISIAEQLGVHPNDLLNELNVGGAIKSGFKAGGVMDAIQRGANAVGHNVKHALRGGSVVPTAANRAYSTAKKVGAYYDEAKTAANGWGGDFEVGMANKHVKIAGKALQGVRKITRNRGMDDAVSPALIDIRKSGY